MVRDVKRRISLPGNLLSELRKNGFEINDLVLYVNSVCSLRCYHCYIGNELLSQSRILDGSSIVNFLSDLTSLSRITILGGEPTLHPDFLEIVSATQKLEIADKRLTTNLISNKAIVNATPILKDFTISVSLDGAAQAVHDRIRGEGSFAKTTKNIMDLVGRGFQIEITHTLMKSNIASFPQFLQLCAALGVTCINLHRMSLHGNAIDHADDQVHPNEWVEFTKQIEREAHGNKNPKFNLRYPPLFTTYEDLEKLVISGVYRHHAKGSYYSNAGGKRVVIYPDGKIYVSSEAFGTESYIASFWPNSLEFNQRDSSELALLAKANVLDNMIPMMNPLQSGSEKYPVVLSVSYKKNVCI